MYTGDDRTEQVNWLRELAGSIVYLWSGDEPVTGAELVDYAFKQGMEVPGWFDDADRRLLVELVDERL